MSRPSAQFESVTHTFSADAKFFDALMAHPSSEAFAEMSVWYTWLQKYLNDIQESLAEAGEPHGETYKIWVVSMLGGMAQALSMVMYLSARGIIHEAAAAGRRALEFLGIASHLVADPAKAEFLSHGDEESKLFRKAFLSGSLREQEELKGSGIKFRFAAMEPKTAKACTTLWGIFSRCNVHGESPAVLAFGTSLIPTEHSCAFCNRSIDATAKAIVLYRPILEIAAIELASLAGRFGVPNQRVKEAGACVLVWLDKQDPRWLERMDCARADLGLPSTPPERANGGEAGVRRASPRIGRNEPCFCGSGKKYKHCCGNLTIH
jgi:hypothetical protein